MVVVRGSGKCNGWAVSPIFIFNHRSFFFLLFPFWLFSKYVSTCGELDFSSDYKRRRNQKEKKKNRVPSHNVEGDHFIPLIGSSPATRTKKTTNKRENLIPRESWVVYIVSAGICARSGHLI